MASVRKAGPKDVLLFELWMTTTKWLLERTQRFPQHLRHTLTQRVDNLAIEILEDLTTAAWSKDKQTPLARADDRLNRLRVILRLCHETQVLSHGHYEEAAKMLGEAGRQLGGWRQSVATHGTGHVSTND